MSNHKWKMRDIVVVIPGIMGSELRKDGNVLWPPTNLKKLQALLHLSNALAELSLTSEEQSDGIQPVRLVTQDLVIPGLLTDRSYTPLKERVSSYFDVICRELGDPRPGNYFEFPYDWRRDNRLAASALKTLITFRLQQWREYKGDPGAKVILLCHSMGGLVARYCLEALNGWQECRLLVTFGTPHRGSLKVLSALSTGLHKWGINVTAFIRSFDSMYQLLPVYAAIEDGSLFKRITEVGPIQGVDENKARRGLEFHNEINTAVEGHLNEPNYLRDRYEVIFITGLGGHTYQSARILLSDSSASERKVSFEYTLPPHVHPLLLGGDNTVPALSATPVEYSGKARNVDFVETHAFLHSNKQVLDYLMGRIKRTQAIGHEQVRDPGDFGMLAQSDMVVLDMDDAYFEGEAIEAIVRPLIPDGTLPNLNAVLLSGETGPIERGPIFRTGKLMILYQLTRSFHETYSPSYFSRRV